MKKVTGLNDRLEHFEDVPEGAQLMLPTVRQVLVKQAASCAAQPNMPEDTITLYELGIKIKNTPLDFVDLEEADFKILAAAIRKNGAQYITHYHGQMLFRLRGWENGDAQK